MKILSIQKHHNSSACLFDDEVLIYYNQEERLSRKKKDYGIPFFCLREIKKIASEIDIVVITGYDHLAAENASIASLLCKMGFIFSDEKIWFSYYKGHHLSHAAKAFYNSNFNESLVVVWDGKGSTFSLSNGTFAHETTSAFYIKYPAEVNLIYKRLYTPFNEKLSDLTIMNESEYGIYDRNQDTYDINHSLIEIRNDHDIGQLYENVSQHIGFGEDQSGKLLGLQSYGKYNKNLPEILNIHENTYYTNMSLFEPINRQKINVDLYPILKKTDDIIGNQSLIDFSFHVQKSLERVGLSVIKNMLDITGAKNLILTGGAALNVVANTVFKKNIPRDVNLYIEPMCGDEGNCIGAAQLYYHSISQSIKKTQFKNLYLGPKPNYQFNLTDGEIEYDNISKKDIVDLLVNQHIVAIFQGGAEAGPRALGNRSLLFDPRVKNGKEIVNSIKRREKFRPFACTVLLEHVQNWFNLEGLQESPYMMYALQALDGIKEKIPSVIHVDGTSRVQTITKDQNLHFYELIEKFYLDTGVPLLFNTSFNLGGEPLVETVQNAIDTLRNSKLEYLYLPEINKLVYIKNR